MEMARACASPTSLEPVASYAQTPTSLARAVTKVSAYCGAPVSLLQP